ncbi:MAG: hypothetical protein ACLQUY_08725 [Ktedonobacterales bacterium]
MSLDDQLAELLATLGVVLEDSSHDSPAALPCSGVPADAGTGPARYQFGGLEGGESEERSAAMEEGIPLDAPSEVSLFQSSREHYGVFYRLDLAQGVPHLRIYLPDDEGCLKMRCYLVRAALSTPLHEWFVATKAHSGSAAYEDIRDTAEQHLLFAAGELMKRLFWTGSIEEMQFPGEIEVMRLL